MNAYVARQPIVDRDLNLYGYELLYRDSIESTGYAGGVDADLATARIMLNSFCATGLEHITAGKRAFVNFTHSLIASELPTLFPKEILVIEILEEIRPTLEIITTCMKLRKKGYLIALDDFIYTPEMMPLLDVCDIVKIDVLGTPIQTIKDTVKSIGNRGITLLAEKVESREMFELLKNIGFELFQGYFFNKPETIVMHKSVSQGTNYFNLLHDLLELSSVNQLNNHKLIRILEKDKLFMEHFLRLANSSWYSLGWQVVDMKQAILQLGIVEVMKLAQIIAFTGLSQYKAEEIVLMALIRAKFLESMSVNITNIHRISLFQTGLLSLVGSMTGRELAEVLQELNAPPITYDALINKKGVISVLIDLVENLENANWVAVDDCASQLGVASPQITGSYISSVRWCNNVIHEVEDFVVSA